MSKKVTPEPEAAGTEWKPSAQANSSATQLRLIAIILWVAAIAAELLHDTPAPAGWEEQARAQFLEGYLETAEPVLLPSGVPAIERLLTVFELEKAVYELRYELDNRPEWVGIPVAGIMRLIEAGAAA